MVPNNDITNNSHTCNKDMDDGIITTTTTTPTSITCDKQKLYQCNPNRYPTQETTTTHFSNVCGGGDGNDGTNTSSFVTYLFVRRDYEKPYIVYVCCCCLYIVKEKRF